MMHIQFVSFVIQHYIKTFHALTTDFLVILLIASYVTHCHSLLNQLLQCRILKQFLIFLLL